jgi:hypothetical protein
MPEKCSMRTSAVRFSRGWSAPTVSRDGFCEEEKPGRAETALPILLFLNEAELPLKEGELERKEEVLLLRMTVAFTDCIVSFNERRSVLTD